MQGKTINGYTMRRLLGVGGMGEVWYAVDAKGKPAAVKFLSEKLSNNAQIVSRFKAEGTQTGSTLGTKIYMSPEQVKDSKRVSPKSDLYSLAVSFVHLLTGKAPYDTDSSSDYDILNNILHKPLDLSGVPMEWRGFLAPYLEKDPAKRPSLRSTSKEKALLFM